MIKLTKRLQQTIKYTVPNLRRRWPKQLEPYSDLAIAKLYDDFATSDDHGDNDKKFPSWFDDLPTYEDKKD